MKSYPQVMSEEATLANCSLKSIARFGDGEWRCAVGGGCTSQRPDPRMAAELRTILHARLDACMVGIPNAFHPDAPRAESWVKYTEPPFRSLLSLEKRAYWSSFITRPDNAPWIDTPGYWENVRGLWKDQNIVLVVGDKKSITTEMMGSEARSVREVIGPRQHAYEKIDQIEEEIGKTSARVLLCLGTTATVLAYRLARKGIHALDLGHIGMFLRHAGSYRYGQDDLTTPAYRAQLVAMHSKKRWGADGGKHTAAVRDLRVRYEPKTTLDYGCGENLLAQSLVAEFRISGYDPGIPERAKMPKPCDMVVCTDVLEHVEPAKLDAVLDHIWRLTSRVAYFVIDVKPANAILPDGRNAHLSLHEPSWWREKLEAIGWKIVTQEGGGKSMTVIAKKP
jgi:Glycosyltransferase GT-D fold